MFFMENLSIFQIGNKVTCTESLMNRSRWVLLFIAYLLALQKFIIIQHENLEYNLQENH